MMFYIDDYDTMNLSDLRPGMEEIELYVKLISLESPKEVETYTGLKHTIVEGKVTDGTDTLDFTVWNEAIEKLEGIQPGDKLELLNAFITSYKGNLAVNMGRESQIIKQ
jgi:ssDNA-binding replication factor A large subunit